MERILFNSNCINYKYIFEYYDFPLAFISDKIENSYYFFYFIDDNQYFVKPLSMKNIELIFSCIPMRDILNEFMKENNFQVIEFINELEAKLYTLSEFEIYQSEPIEICLPEPDMEFEYEYNKGCKFSELISIFRRNHG